MGLIDFSRGLAQGLRINYHIFFCNSYFTDAKAKGYAGSLKVDH